MSPSLMALESTLPQKPSVDCVSIGILTQNGGPGTPAGNGKWTPLTPNVQIPLNPNEMQLVIYRQPRCASNPLHNAALPLNWSPRFNIPDQCGSTRPLGCQFEPLEQDHRSLLHEMSIISLRKDLEDVKWAGAKLSHFFFFFNLKRFVLISSVAISSISSIRHSMVKAGKFKWKSESSL